MKIINFWQTPVSLSVYSLPIWIGPQMFTITLLCFLLFADLLYAGKSVTNVTTATRQVCCAKKSEGSNKHLNFVQLKEAMEM